MHGTKRTEACFCGGLAILLTLSLTACALAQYFGACRTLRSDVLRLHVIANSDSAGDQAVKLAVRDALLTESAKIFSGDITAQAAAKAIAPALPALEETANAVLREQGFSYTAAAAVTCEYFDTRAYENFTLPAGNYTALKIVLGEGKGRNWWCVMFPPLCLPAAAPEDVSAVFSEAEYQVAAPENGFQVRLKIAEIFERFKAKRTNRAVR